MIKVEIKKELNCDKKRIWNIISDNSNYAWRSDLSKIEVIDENHFIEYDKNNFPTYFTIIKKENEKEYQFDIENKNIKGKWIGALKELSNKNTMISFIKEIEVNNILMKILAKPYLKKQQKRYIKDLENAVFK